MVADSVIYVFFCFPVSLGFERERGSGMDDSYIQIIPPDGETALCMQMSEFY